MDSPGNFEGEQEVATVCVQRRTNAGPWFNKNEFKNVHEWIFGPNANLETKQNAIKQMKIWKLRRLHLTSGAILSTLLILEAELKDVKYTEDGRAEDARALYASSFTRFLNYMSAISQSQNMKTMYAAARELNIDPFLVDLRHICAHSHVMPSIDVFRRSSKYCLDWLREFYWDVQKEVMVDVEAKNVRKKDTTTFDVNVREQFLIYDATTEALARGCHRVAEAKKLLAKDRFVPLKRFAATIKEDQLKALVELSVASIFKSTRQGSKLKDVSQIFVDAFLEMTYFFETGGESPSKKSLKVLIRRHQGLFQSIAICGLIEELFHAFVELAENEFESVVRRTGAGFWAKHIVFGLSALRKVKAVQAREKQVDPNRAFSLNSMNMKFISRRVIEIYDMLGLDVKSILMFGDSAKCPWSLSFNREYVVERMEHINEYTVDLVRSCLELVEPPLSKTIRASLVDLIDIRMKNNIAIDVNMDDDRIFTLHKDVLQNGVVDEEMRECNGESIQSEECGIWTQVSDGQNWQSCPLGRLLWE